MIAIGRLQDTLLALKEEAVHLTWTSVSSAEVARERILLNLLPPRRDQGSLGGEQGGRSSDGQEGLIKVVQGVQGGQRGWIVLSGWRWNKGVELGGRAQAGTGGIWTPLAALGATVGIEGTFHWCHL